MLPLPRRDQPAVVERIHRKAVRYYSQLSTRTHSAEIGDEMPELVSYTARSTGVAVTGARSRSCSGPGKDEPG
ncbi:hypothetical protein [Streptomyces sp. NPDC088755]|uniref:hypothetical protein n=1 Tax=Streptomyces sp. NPDC088755 TaxID=3365888 RepID=UPI00382DC6C0